MSQSGRVARLPALNPSLANEAPSWPPQNIASVDDSATRPHKRRYTTSETTDLDPPFIMSATPSQTQYEDSQEDLQSKATTTVFPRIVVNTRNNPSFNNNNHATQNMDPLPTEPGVIFIHPPFTEFPNANLHDHHLTYNLMAKPAHNEWFLDANDFLTSDDPTNPDKVRYPSQLEPPRGWCPTRKKDLADGWPDGEPPRLRCTFCRRTYAGVNAKSMWRRHVFEKHKIAMASRRDNTERKGRGSNSQSTIIYDVDVRRTDGIIFRGEQV